ncbi:CAP domain-containing protein [Niallia endozanthoxylica]|uniref:Sporulation protein n=1 Tax=Niallia endozanthoxylica TaxID=2036016 RepID=A0A5J5I4U4_9BACI|nr:CAP domain-containing protein [Niallia endozanthoxylica]KAA9030613.1 sporulation protein [Niallia endozanthoxylica]
MFKKKVMLTIAAAATIAMASPVVEKASAAENTMTVQKKVYVYQGHNLAEWNNYLQKYFASLGYKTTTNTTTQQNPATTPETQTPVEQAPVVQTPSPTTQTPVEQQAPATEQQTPQTTSALSEYEQKVVDLTNQERAKNGLAPLQVDTELSKVAREKSLDMANKGYFSHTSPTYGSPFDMMKQFGISYRAAGENIAMGQRSPEEVVQAWMNSEGHRKNILSANFTHIGVGHSQQGNYWTQMFIGK